MKHPISLTLFFPVYNEEENIHELIESTVRVVEESPYIGDYEVLIINDGSADHTKEIADQLASEYPTVRAIHHPKNKGYGAALRTGFKEATKDYVFFTDGDLQFDILELNNLIIHLDEYGDMVVGYRAPRRDPFMRRLNAYAWNVLNRVLFGLRMRDIDCAFKLFKRETVQKLQLRSRGAMINAELLIRLQRKGIPVKEVPVSHLPRQRGSATGAKPSVIVRALREMADLYRGDLGLATQKQALKFACVGVLNTLVDMSVYVILTRGAGLSLLLVAKFISFMTGTVSSLVLNRTWTFGLRTRITGAELVRFYTMVSISLVANLSAMYLAVTMLRLPDLAGLVIATLVSLAASYTLSRFWVFRTDRRAATRFALPRALLILLMGAALVALPGVTVHAQDDTASHGNSAAARGRHGQGQNQNAESATSQIAQPVAPTQPAQPNQPSIYTFTPYPFYQPTVSGTTTSASTTAVATTTASKRTAATSTPVSGNTTPIIGTAAPSQTSVPSAITNLKEMLFPGSAYPAAHLSAATTRTFMLMAGLFAAAGVSFLAYGALAASATRRSTLRHFRRIPIAAR